MGENDYDDDELDQGIYLFGCNILSIRCMRRSLLSAYLGGFLGLIGGVWLSNNFRHAMHAGLGGFFTFASGAWILCRYQSNKKMTGLIGVTSERMKKVGGNQYILPRGLVQMRRIDNFKPLEEWEHEESISEKNEL